MSNIRFAVGLTVTAALAPVSGCAPTHYSVAIARGPNRVTYAQRNADITREDYLVDCALNQDHAPTDCVVVALPTE